MTTATADERAQRATPDEHGQALEEGEITRILKTVQAAQFKKSETLATTEDTIFKPRSLVEIAFSADQKRQQAEEAARQEKEKQGTARGNEAEIGSEKADNAGSSMPDNQTDLPSENQLVSAQEDGSVSVAPAEVSEKPTQVQQQSEEAAREKRAEEEQVIRIAAEEDGYKRGFEAGLEAARQTEPTPEELALVEEKEQQRQDIVAQFHDAISALASPEALDSVALEAAINQAVLELASERAGMVISDNPEGILARIRGLIDNIKAAAELVEIYMNPSDLASLENWLQYKSAPSGWTFSADAQLLSGDIRLRIGGIEVADQLNICSDKKAEPLKENSVGLAKHLSEEQFTTEDSDVVPVQKEDEAQDEQSEQGLDEQLGEELHDETEKSSRLENAKVAVRPPFIPQANEEVEEEDNGSSGASEKESLDERGKE